MVCLQRTLLGEDLGSFQWGKRREWRLESGALAYESRSYSPSGRSESAITEVPTPCAHIRVIPSLAARTSQWSAVSTGPCSCYCQRSVTAGCVAFRFWTTSDGYEPCSPVLRHGLMPTEPGTLTERFRGDGRVLSYMIEAQGLLCNPTQKQVSLFS